MQAVQDYPKTGATAFIAVMMLVALGIPRSPAQDDTRCEAEKARFAVGETFTPELAARAVRAAGARLMRKIEPGSAATMELRPGRQPKHRDPRNLRVRDFLPRPIEGSRQ